MCQVTLGHPALMHFLHSHQSLSAPCLSRHTCTSVYIVHGGRMPQCCDPQGYGRYDSMEGIGRLRLEQAVESNVWMGEG